MSSLSTYFISCMQWLENWNPYPALDDILDAILSVYGNGPDQELWRERNSDTDSDSGSSVYSQCILESDNYDFISSESELSESESESEYLGDSQIHPSCLSNPENDERIKPRIISVEGNIGAGKTTLLRKLQKKYADCNDILFLEEPLDIWQTFREGGPENKNILEKFYENPSKYAFMFQILAFQSRYEMIHRAVQENPQVKTIVLERSLDADYHIFAKHLVADGVMEKIAFDIYFYTVRERLAEYGSDGIIWLDVEPEECHRRVQGRGREGEAGITMDYLRGCEEAHREWLSADLGFVLRLDGSASSSSDTQMEEIHTYLF